jgi:hypothetical protein
MKAIANIFTLFLTSMYITTMHTNSQAIVANNNSSVPAVFVASTPCSSGTKPLPGIPREAGCELIKWELKLFGDIGKQTAGTYVLNCVYGMPKQGTRGFINGGSRIHREGKWIIIKGRGTNLSAIIYRLDPNKPLVSVSFLRLNENLLHLLDSHLQLMIGTGAWSYTLNRIQ